MPALMALQLEDHEAVKERLELEKAGAEAKLAQERKTAQARLEREVNTAAAQAALRAASPSRPTTSHRNAGKPSRLIVSDNALYQQAA